MDEARLQAYINLIEQLLTCSDDEESNILQANQELIDPEFLQVMENYATGLEEQGNNNHAAWLRNIEQQLGQYLNPQAGGIEEYQEFLLEVLQVKYESNSDPTVVYPILQRRQHLLDDTFAQLLQQYARNVFSQGKTKDVAVIARVIENLCIDIKNFPLGSRANNLEIAITGYHTLLEVYTRDAFPEYWAGTQNNLGNAYSDRIRGERADNLEKAIAAYNLSLEVYTRDAFPEDWGRSQNNLGSAYKNRIKGDIAENIETAIFCYQEALKIRTFDAFPLDWATTQNNLGNAYSNRIRGNKAENIENAITCHQNALQIYTREAFPEDWAETQYNLANTLRERFKLLGKVEDIEQAITVYKRGREIIEKTEDQELYFNYSYQLGKALFEGGYYTEAIEHLETCQQSYQKQKNITSLAPILLELARLYHRTGRLEQARLYFKDSLRLFRRLGDQENVAFVTSALGNLEIQIGKISQACSHLKEAQEYYQENNNAERLDEINYLLKILQSA
jgi:tetratricopeptide (TPR) repeat protein